MKTNVPPNRKTGRMIAKNLIILLVFLLICFMAIWAWFSNKTKAEASGINVECKAPDGIEIAVVAPNEKPKNEDYTTGGITLGGQDFLQKLVLSEVTSDGIDFYKPALVQSGGIASPNTEADWDKAVANDSYISFDLYIRAKSSQIVSLDTTSKVMTSSDIITGADSGNKSSLGDFSRDCVAGASRISVIDPSDGNKRKLLWIPRPDIVFSDESGAPSVTLNVESGESYRHSYYEVTEAAKVFKLTNSALVTTSEKDEKSGEYRLKTKTELARLSSIGEDKYYTKMVRCNIWIDGTDSEDRLALAGGKFNVYLDLTVK